MLLPVRDHELEFEGHQLAELRGRERQFGLPFVALLPGQPQSAIGAPVAELLQIAAEVDCPSVLKFLDQLEDYALLGERTALPRLLPLHILKI